MALMVFFYLCTQVGKTIETHTIDVVIYRLAYYVFFSV